MTAAQTQTSGAMPDQARHVADVAQSEAQNVAAEAKTQAANLLAETKVQLEEQSRTQRDRLVDTLRTVGDDLDQMAGQANRGVATDLARQVAQQAHAFSKRLQGREPAEILEDVRDFARRKPGTFLLASLAAGIVAGRLARGAKAANESSTPRSTTTSSPDTGTVPVQSREAKPLLGSDLGGVSEPVSPVGYARTEQQGTP
jgi:hypothetical protein